ncbi:MAG: ABC transporter ATP-binding protein [Promethearchaeota archaeon]
MGFLKSAQMTINYSFKSKVAMLKTIILMGFGSLSAVFIPRITEFIINGIIPGTSNPINQFQVIIFVLLAIGIGLISALFSANSRYQSGIVATNAIYYLRKNIYNSINRQSFSFFDKTETGQLVSRSTSDIETCAPLFGMGITFAVQSIMTVVISIVMLLDMNISLALIVLISVPIYLSLLLIMAFKLKIPFIKSRESFGNLTTVIRENILGSQVVRIFNSRQKEKSKFNKHNKEFRDLTNKAIKIQSILNPLVRFYLGLITIIGIYFGGLMVVQNQIQIGTLVAFISYCVILTNPLWMLIMVLTQFVQADAALTRVNEILELTPEIKEIKNPISAKRIDGKVEFKNVSFGYTSTLILHNLSFSISKGEKVAMLGTTGSGKSTLISLLPRFYDVISGEILIDEKNIRDYNLEELRGQIGLVSQNIFLFNDSIAKNIAYGKEGASIEEIKMAAKSANIAEFIEDLPNKYDTIVGERGTQLSGGQKQRIAIARALLIKPKILILDDSTSSVDVETEFKIQSALKSLLKEQTTFIITQRLSTIRDADKIMVMDKGRIVGLGIHEDLFSKNPLYRQIYETLFRKQKKIDVNIKSNTEVINNE